MQVEVYAVDAWLNVCTCFYAALGPGSPTIVQSWGSPYVLFFLSMVKLGTLKRALTEAHVQKREAALTPKPPAYDEFFAPLPLLSRPLRVAKGCAGVDYGESFAVMKTKHESHMYDIEEKYEQALLQMFVDVHGASPQLHLGKQKGDVCKVRLLDLEPAPLF